MDPSPGRSPAPGVTLGHYRLIERVGAGGMGEVWRARDQRLERDVALKLLLPGTLADEAARKRFRREALALSKLGHPNIATVFDFDTQDGLDFLVMEYVAGPVVTERLAEGPLPEAEVARLGVQLAEGLAAAHAQGIIHRDLKPGNVQFTRDGRLKILDFGLAKLVRPTEGRSLTESLTESQALVGTLAYMAPEQVRGEAADARSDLWAAGLVLYELATGRRAYPEEQSAQVLYAILNQAPTAPRSLNRRVSTGLEAIILKCLAREPVRRYQTAGELAADLQRLLGGLTAEAERSRVRARRVRWLSIAVPVAVVVVMALLTALNVGGLRSRLFARAPIRSIAVLPLANLSGDTNQEYFADGMTEELINDLGKLSALRVISRTSAMTYKGARKPLKQIARELGVDAILEGSLLRSGDRVRIAAQLIRTPEERQLWADSYERTSGDVLGIPAEVVGAVARKLGLDLTPEQRARIAAPREVNAEAHDEYLRGRFFLNKLDERQFRTALEHFQRSAQFDPLYAPAWNGIAEAYVALSNLYLPPRVAIPQAMAAAKQAVRLDSTLAEAHATLAALHSLQDWNWKGTERECRRALELNPSSSEVHAAYAGLLQNIGRFDASIAEYGQAMKLDPLSLGLRVAGAWPYYLAGRYEEGIKAWREAEALEPNYAPTHYNLGMAYETMGRFPEAIEEVRKAVALADHPAPLALLCHVYARAGRREDALRTLDQLNQVAKKQHVAAYWFAFAHAGLGDKDQAFRYLEKSCEDREDDILNLKVDPKFAMLRSDPRFQALLRRIGFPD